MLSMHDICNDLRFLASDDASKRMKIGDSIGMHVRVSDISDWGKDLAMVLIHAHTFDCVIWFKDALR
jgi:hypothetical protein